MQVENSGPVEVIAGWREIQGPGDVPGEKEKLGPVDEPQNISIPSGSMFAPHIEEETFGEQPLFSTTQRPMDFRRSMDFYRTSSGSGSANFDDLQAWFSTFKIYIGTHLTTQEQEQAIRLLYCWRDLFVEDMETL